MKATISQGDGGGGGAVTPTREVQSEPTTLASDDEAGSTGNGWRRSLVGSSPAAGGARTHQQQHHLHRQHHHQPNSDSNAEDDDNDDEEDESEDEKAKPKTVATAVPSRMFQSRGHSQKGGGSGPRSHLDDMVWRMASVASLPVVSTAHDDDDDSTAGLLRRSAVQTSTSPSKLTPYERVTNLLASDPLFLKEVTLGKRIGFYRLGKELGAGNFSKVKLGIHVLAKEKVAVKIMEKTRMDAKAQRLLSREIACLERTHHPNIIRLFECVETLTRIHLVLEYAGGGELYALVQERGKLSEADAKPMFAQIVAAISHLHSRSIVHRDIKAENVMFTDNGQVKIVDFGFSCCVEPGNLLNTFCGSPPYAAPELFRHRSSAVAAAASSTKIADSTSTTITTSVDSSYSGSAVDVWALGVLLYFMLVGQTPFRGDTVHELRTAITSGAYFLPDHISTFAQHLLTRMLEMDASKRITVLHLKKTYWLRDVKMPSSYLRIAVSPTPPHPDAPTSSSVPAARKPASSAWTGAHSDDPDLEQRVWAQLAEYGVLGEHLAEVERQLAGDSADCSGVSSSGPRHALIGLYRITTHQQLAIERARKEAALQSSRRPPHPASLPNVRQRSGIFPSVRSGRTAAAQGAQQQSSTTGSATSRLGLMNERSKTCTLL